MKGTMRRIPFSELALRPTRTDHGSDDELKALARSWLDRAVHPILVRSGPPLSVVDGHRRIMGMSLLGETAAEVLVIDGTVTDSEAMEIAFESAYHRADLRPVEKAIVVRDYGARCPGITSQEIADKFHCDPATVTRLMSLWKTPPEVQQAAMENRLSVKAWYQISLAEPDRRLGLLAMYLSGMAVTQVEQAARKARAPKAEEAVKTGSLRIALGGVVITVKGADLTLGLVAEVLDKAGKEAEKAKAQGLNAKTAERVWKDRAAKKAI